jgi:hypothetical protein
MEILSDLEIEEKYFDPLYSKAYSNYQDLKTEITAQHFQVFTVLQFATQIGNGGLFQYFWNIEAKYMDDLLIGLELIGDEKRKTIVVDAWKFVQPKLAFLLETKQNSGLEAFDSVAEEFNYLSEIETELIHRSYELNDKVIAFVRQNPQFFKELN